MKKGLKPYALLLLLASFSGCRGHLPEAPKVTLCAHSIESKGFVCLKPDNESFFLPYEKAPNYSASHPDDAERIDQYILSLEKEVVKCRSQ